MKKTQNSSAHSTARIIATSALGFALAMLAASCAAKNGNAAASKTQQATDPVAISMAKPQMTTVQGELVFSGTLHAKDEVDVVAETQGKVIKVFIDTGSRVYKGDSLVQIEDDLKQEAFKTAQASYDKSKSDWDRAQGLFDQKAISDADRQDAKLALVNAESQLLSARKDLENARVRAPQGGVVTQRYVGVGSMLSGGTPVAHIVDADDLKLTIQVGERDVLKVRPGQIVSVESDLYPGASFRGTVSTVSPKGDSTLSFPVEVSLKADPRRLLYDGMSAKARIGIGAKTILAIPRACIVGSFQSPQVYVVEGGVAKLKAISLGGEYGTNLEVLSGLGEDDQVATNGINNLSDGTAVAVTEGTTK
jgi:RND family efflux transporter MFP subunit